MKKLGTVFFILAAGALWCQEPRAQWALQENLTSAGRGIILTLQVTGTDQVVLPELRVEGVDVQLVSSQPTRSASSITINGKTTAEVRTGYQAAWRLTSVRAGTYRLQGISVSLDGKTVPLPDLAWSVRPPQSSRDFRLTHSFAPQDMVPGLEGVYTLKWYLGETAQDPVFQLPILDSGLFEWLEEPPVAQNTDRVILEYRGRQFTGEKSAEIVDGRQFTVIIFTFRLRALKAGELDLSTTTVAFQGAVSYREYYDFFGDKKRQPVFESLSIPAGALKISVLDFPRSGRPENFSGLVGSLKLEWTLPPGPYRVGESIPLTLKLTGLLNMKELDLDYMVRQAYDQTDFRISGGSPASGGGREYSLRAAKPGKLLLPGLRLNYFNPETRTYGWAETPPQELLVEGSPGQEVSPGVPEAVIGYRPPQPTDSRLPSSGLLFFLLPLGTLCYLLGKGMRRSAGALKRRAGKKFLKHLKAVGAQDIETVSPKEGLGRGLEILEQLRSQALEAGLFPGISELWDRERRCWEEAYYSPENPPWDPGRRLREWTEECRRALV